MAKQNKPDSKATFIRLPLDLRAKAAKIAADEDRSMSNMLVVLVREAIEARKV